MIIGARGLSSFYHILYIDVSDTLRPPGLDILVLLLAILGAILVSIQPVTSPLIASRMVLDPTLLALALFLAIRSSAGLATLIQTGVINVYLSYPLSKATIALVLLISRVLIPSLLILAVPLATSIILLGPTMYKGLDVILSSYASFLLQSLLYGSLFILIAVRVRSQASSGILSVAVYFTYIALNLILSGIGSAIGNEILRKVGDSMFLPEIVYHAYTSGDYDIWQLALVPTLATTAMIAYLVYFSRRFEVA